MIHIIYMAAGNSRRFGSNKLFYELDGKPMYRHLLDRLAEIKNRYNKSKSDSQTIDITVVTRYREILTTAHVSLLLFCFVDLDFIAVLYRFFFQLIKQFVTSKTAAVSSRHVYDMNHFTLRSFSCQFGSTIPISIFSGVNGTVLCHTPVAR